MCGASPSRVVTAIWAEARSLQCFRIRLNPATYHMHVRADLHNQRHQAETPKDHASSNANMSHLQPGASAVKPPLSNSFNHHTSSTTFADVDDLLLDPPPRPPLTSGGNPPDVPQHAPLPVTAQVHPRLLAWTQNQEAFPMALHILDTTQSRVPIPWPPLLKRFISGACHPGTNPSNEFF